MIKYRFFALLTSLILLSSCNEKCDCNFTIITASEQFILDNKSNIPMSNDIKIMAESTIKVYQNSFPEKYLHRSLTELCTFDDNGKQNTAQNTPCRLSYFVGREENQFKIHNNGTSNNEIVIHKSKKPMVVGGQNFNLYSLEYPSTIKDRIVQFVYEIDGHEFLSKPYYLKDGSLRLRSGN